MCKGGADDGGDRAGNTSAMIVEASVEVGIVQGGGWGVQVLE